MFPVRCPSLDHLRQKLSVFEYHPVVSEWTASGIDVYGDFFRELCITALNDPTRIVF